MAEHYIAIDNVCAWPNLTLLPDGTIVAVIHNQPCHGQWEGDIECWASNDGGRNWEFRSKITRHEPGTSRFNVSVGLAVNGDLVVLVSGWRGIPPRSEPKFRNGGQTDPATGQILPAQINIIEGGDNVAHVFFRDKELLPVQVCRSSDGGKTWNIADAKLNTKATYGGEAVPFGDILTGGDGALYASAYLDANQSFFLRSADDGHTWSVRSSIAKYTLPCPKGSPVSGFNETAIFHLGEGRWIAAARTHKQKEAFKCLQLFRSDDEGKTWRFDQNLSLPQQIPAHFLRLDDGRILLSYGMRNPNDYGVAVRISDDEGHTWAVPLMLVRYPDADGGYPSSVQTADGKIVTAYYCASQPFHNRYHMGVVIWDPDEISCKGWLR